MHCIHTHSCGGHKGIVVKLTQPLCFVLLRKIKFALILCRDRTYKGERGMASVASSAFAACTRPPSPKPPSSPTFHKLRRWPITQSIQGHPSKWDIRLVSHFLNMDGLKNSSELRIYCINKNAFWFLPHLVKSIHCGQSSYWCVSKLKSTSRERHGLTMAHVLLLQQGTFYSHLLV